MYVGFNSPSTIHYLELTIGNILTVCFSGCQSDELTFPLLGVGTKMDQIVMFEWLKINQYCQNFLLKWGREILWILWIRNLQKIVDNARWTSQYEVAKYESCYKCACSHSYCGMIGKCQESQRKHGWSIRSNTKHVSFKHQNTQLCNTIPSISNLVSLIIQSMKSPRLLITLSLW